MPGGIARSSLGGVSFEELDNIGEWIWQLLLLYEIYICIRTLQVNKVLGGILTTLAPSLINF